MAVIAGERLIPASEDVQGLPRSTLGMPEPAELADISAAEDVYEDQASCLVAALAMKSVTVPAAWLPELPVQSGGLGAVPSTAVSNRREDVALLLSTHGATSLTAL